MIWTFGVINNIIQLLCWFHCVFANDYFVLICFEFEFFLETNVISNFLNLSSQSLISRFFCWRCAAGGCSNRHPIPDHVHPHFGTLFQTRH